MEKTSKGSAAAIQRSPNTAAPTSTIAKYAANHSRTVHRNVDVRGDQLHPDEGEQPEAGRPQPDPVRQPRARPRAGSPPLTRDISQCTLRTGLTAL